MSEFEFGVEAFGDVVEQVDLPDFVDDLIGGGHDGQAFDADSYSYDLVGADPDEDGLWNQLMVDLTDGGNPYVAN